MKTKITIIFTVLFFILIGMQYTNGQELRQCSGNGVNVRKSPDSNGSVLGKLKQNDFVYVYKDNSNANFLKIDYQGQEAFVSKQFLKAADSPNNSGINVSTTRSIIAKTDGYDKHIKKAALTQNEKNTLKADKLECISSKKKLV